MDEIGKALSVYAQDVADIAGSPGSTEATFYPAVQRLLAAVLKARNLPFNVRVNTSQRRGAGGTDLPDLALYDGAGDFVAVFGEVKPPSVESADLAVSTDRNDQIGRWGSGCRRRGRAKPRRRRRAPSLVARRLPAEAAPHGHFTWAVPWSRSRPFFVATPSTLTK